MYNNRSGGDRGEGRFGAKRFGSRSFGDRDSAPRAMFKAVCAVCGEPCEVPFRPSGSRPIYCSKHFEGRENDQGGSRRDSRSFDRPRFEDHRRPQEGSSENSGRANAQLLGELKSLNVKMDRILSAIESKPEKLKSPKSKAPKKEVSSEESAVEQIVAEPPKVE